MSLDDVNHDIFEPNIVELPLLVEQDGGDNEMNIKNDADDEKDSEEEKESNAENESSKETNSENHMNDLIDVHVGGFEDNVVESYSCYEIDDGYPDTPMATDEEWANFDIEKQKKGHKKHPFRSHGEVRLSLMQEFESADEFKDVVFRYALSTGYDIRFTRSSREKIEAKCTDTGCSWRVYSSIEKRNNKWMIKSYQEEHTCVKSGRTRILKIPLIAKLFLERIRRKPELNASEIRDEIKREFNISVSKNQCSKAKTKALYMIRGDFTDQFAKLWDYEFEINRSNPGSSTELQTVRVGSGGAELFHRFYVCFAALKIAWKQNCRPIIGFDGCFLKWAIQGEVLAAVGRDACNKIYPIAWAVVGVENTDSWEWFIRKVKSDLGLGIGVGFTILTDQQKGLLKVIAQEFPKAEHRMCARHIYANWRKQHKDGMLKPLFWQLAKSYNIPAYEENVELLRKLNPEACMSLLSRNPQSWCRAFFQDTSRCPDVHNNLSESFNSTIKQARKKPLIDMLEDIRRQAMQRIARRSEKSMRWKGKFTPKAQKDIEKARSDALGCVMYTSTQGRYEIDDCGTAYTVSLSTKSCACRQWDLTGIPCQHAICAITENNLNLGEYVSEYFLTSKWQETYRVSINPMNGERLWRKLGKGPIYAPELRINPGRPKKHNRIKDPHESPSKVRKVSHHGRVVTCTHCREQGHNKTSCMRKMEPPVPDPKLAARKPRGRPRKEQIGESSNSVSRIPKRGRPRNSERLLTATTSEGTASQGDKRRRMSSTDASGEVSQNTSSVLGAPPTSQPTQSSQTSRLRVEARQEHSGQHNLGIRRTEKVSQGDGLYVSPYTNNMFLHTGPRRVIQITGQRPPP